MFRKAFLAAVASLSIAALALCGEPFRFVQMTDVHLGSGKRDIEVCQAIKSDIEELPGKTEFVVVTGDIFDKGLEDPPPELVRQWQDFQHSFKIPVFVIPGNHDFYGKGDAQACPANFKKLIGPLSSVYECKGWRMVFFCELPLTKWSGPVAGYEPLDWLEKALDAGNPEPSIVFMHVPPNKQWRPQDLDAWRELLRKAHVKAAICGHNHDDELYWDGDLPVFVSEPSTEKKNAKPAYKVFSIDKDGRIAFATRYVNDSKKSAKEKAKAKDESKESKKNAEAAKPEADAPSAGK